MNDRTIIDSSQYFSSIDKLVEFGLGLGIAQQMVSSMNLAMQQVHVPGQMPVNVHSNFEKEWYYAIGTLPVGPLSERELKQRLMNKEIDKNTLVWTMGMKVWQSVEQTPEVLTMIMQLPPSL